MDPDQLQTIIEELQQLRIRQVQLLEAIDNVISHTEPANDNTQLQVGDRVLITNKIRRPLNRPVNQGDRVAVITKILPNHINIRTDNGNNTWRAPHYLRKLTNDE